MSRDYPPNVFRPMYTDERSNGSSERRLPRHRVDDDHIGRNPYFTPPYGGFDNKADYYSSQRHVGRSIDNNSGTPIKQKQPRSVKKITTRFANKTSLQGINYITEAGHFWTRVLWTSVFIAGIAVGAWQLVGILQKYLTHPIATKLSISYTTLDFPSVTICNVNPLRESQLHLDPRMDKYIQRLRENWQQSNYAGPDPAMGPGKKADPPPPPPPTTTPEADSTVARRKKRQIFGDFDNMNTSEYTYEYVYDEFQYEDSEDEQEFGAGQVAEDYKSDLQFQDLNGQIPRKRRLIMGHQKNETILHCSFNGRKCGPRNFTTILNKKYGNCFQFNVPYTRPLGPLKAKNAGEQHGLNLILYKQDIEYLRGYTQHSGFRLDIHPYRTMPFPSESGFSLSPGQETDIGVRLVNITRLGKPFWECEESDAYKLLYQTDYSIETCINTCEDRLIASTCNCFRVANYELVPIQNRTLRQCREDPKAKKCIQDIKRNMSETDLCNCKKACSEQDLELQPSYSIWPNPSVWKKMVDLVCSNNPEGRDCAHIVARTQSEDEHKIRNVLSSNFVSLKIYYVHLNYEQLEEVEDYGFATLGADVGGVLGLWLGFSVFTVLEVVDLVIQLGVYLCILKPHRAATRKEHDHNHHHDTSHRPNSADQHNQHRLRRY